MNRPNKITIATTLLKRLSGENITITRPQLEELCDKTGNDIRAIINALQFYQSNTQSVESSKDSVHRLDIFSASAMVIGHFMPLLRAEDIIYIDYNIIPLMIQEAYPKCCKESLDELAYMSDMLSMSDTLTSVIHTTYDWSLLPVYISMVALVATLLPGTGGFQQFPQFLGRYSKRMKHTRRMTEMAKKTHTSSSRIRIDYVDALQRILMRPLTQLNCTKNDIQSVISKLDVLSLSRDDMMETIPEILMYPIEIPTKTKSAFTREYNKISVWSGATRSKTKIIVTDVDVDGDGDDADADGDDADGDELEDNITDLFV
jgi:replication factor C subunit 1